MWLDDDADGRIDAGEYRPAPDRSDGFYVPDDRGDLWQAAGESIRRIPFAGLSPAGVPRWDWSRAETRPAPPEFVAARRVRYLPERDLLVVAGNSGDDRNQHWKPSGPFLAVYSGWSQGRAEKQWSLLLPYLRGTEGHESQEPASFDVAGDYVFVVYSRGYPDDDLRWAHVRIFRLADGAYVGRLACERELGEVGLVDLVESIRAVRTSGGEYYVFQEDDLKAKVVLYRWKP
jgi:hypothetical protein